MACALNPGKTLQYAAPGVRWGLVNVIMRELAPIGRLAPIGETALGCDTKHNVETCNRSHPGANSRMITVSRPDTGPANPRRSTDGQKHGAKQRGWIRALSRQGPLGLSIWLEGNLAALCIYEDVVQYEKKKRDHADSRNT